MNDTEPVRHEHIGERSEFLREGLALCLVLARFTGVEADVFENGHIAVAEAFDRLLGALANGVRRKRDRRLEKLAQSIHGGLEGELGIRRALGTAEVSGHNDTRALLAKSVDGRQRSTNTAIIRDGRAVERNVEIGAYENALAGEIAE